MSSPMSRFKARQAGEAVIDPVPKMSPPRARRTDPSTSHAAARSVRNQRESQQAVLAMFRHYGNMTDEQLVARYGDRQPPQSPSGLRTRRNELVDDFGLLKDTGRKVRMKSGRMAIVWGLA